MNTTLRHPAATIRPSTAPGTARLLWLDLLRATALLVVVAGHYLQALVHLPVGGTLEVSFLLDRSGLFGQVLTWPMQVMPAFFAVGAYAAALQLADRPITDLRRWSDWMTGRLRRLVVPAIPLLVLWVAAGPLLANRLAADVVSVATAAALVPLWFLAVYVIVQALVPAWVTLLDRHRWWVLAGGLLVAAAAVDAAHLAGVPGIGYANFVLVWSVPTLLGVAVQGGRIDTAALRRLVVAALVGAGLLITYLGYEIAVVGITGTGRSNNSPPSLLLACHAIAYTGAALAVGPRLERALHATRRRRLVLARASAWSMPVYLWHMTGLVAVVGLELVTDVPGITRLLAIEPLTSAWWATRPLWLVAALVPTLLLIVLTRRPSLWLAGRSRAVAPPVPLAVAIAIACCSAGIGVLVTGRNEGVAVMPSLLLAAGLIAMHRPARAGDGRPRPGGPGRMVGHRARR